MLIAHKSSDLASSHTKSTGCLLLKRPKQFGFNMHGMSFTVSYTRCTRQSPPLTRRRSRAIQLPGSVHRQYHSSLVIRLTPLTHSSCSNERLFLQKSPHSRQPPSHSLFHCPTLSKNTTVVDSRPHPSAVASASFSSRIRFRHRVGGG